MKISAHYHAMVRVGHVAELLTASQECQILYNPMIIRVLRQRVGGTHSQQEVPNLIATGGNIVFGRQIGIAAVGIAQI